jgi:AAA+ ATPase superfamily predicted ATPase
MQVKIKKLEVATIKPHRLILLIGRRSSGKSTLLRDLLANFKERFDYVVAMCPTMESSTMLRQCLPESCVYDRFLQSKVDALVKLASELAAAGKERRFALILDDVMYDKAICRTPAFRFLFYNGRHALASETRHNN